MIERMLVPMMVLIPLLGGLLLLTPLSAFGRPSFIRQFAMINTLATFAISLMVLAIFDIDGDDVIQLQSTGTWIPQFGLSFGFGIIDSLSLWLVLLTTFLMPLVILGSFSTIAERTKEFFVWLLILEAAMIGTFVATDVIFFYTCFEFTLVPLFFLIGIYGSGQRRKAARVFFLYTFTGSMLTFAGVLYVAWYAASIDYGNWSFDMTRLVFVARNMSDTQQAWVLTSLLAGFAVKVPLFPVHTWLPLAHTEAPTAGSVVLAGVLLKLGTYGLLRFALPMCPDAVSVFAPYIGVLAVIGVLYTALICWVQKDIKKLIAYSSVSHLGFCVLGMFALNTIGISGSIMYMINHGLSTGALFLCVGMVYERFHTRQIHDMSGLAKVLPLWSFFMVFFCLASMGLPGLNGFIGEFLTLLGAFTSEKMGWPYAVAAGFGMIFTAIYILFVVGKVVFGPVKIPGGEGGRGGNEPVGDLNRREIMTLAPLAIGCLVLGLYPKLILQSLERPVENLVQAQSRAHVLSLKEIESSKTQIRLVTGD